MDNQNYPNNPQQPYQPNYGYQQPQGQPPMKPDNYLVWAILTTVLCCLPFGIVSIIYASKVDGLYMQGNYQAAQDASDKAKNWAMWGAIIGGVSTILIIILYFVIVAGAIASNGGF